MFVIQINIHTKHIVFHFLTDKAVLVYRSEVTPLAYSFVLLSVFVIATSYELYSVLYLPTDNVLLWFEDE